METLVLAVYFMVGIGGAIVDYKETDGIGVSILYVILWPIILSAKLNAAINRYLDL